MHSRPFPCVCFNFFFSSPNQIPYSSGSRSFCVWLWLYKNFTTPSLPWVALQQWVQGVTGLKTLCLIRHCCKHASRCYLGCRSYFASVTPSFTPVIRHAWCCARWSELVFARELVRFWVSCCFQSVWIATLMPFARGGEDEGFALGCESVSSFGSIAARKRSDPGSARIRGVNECVWFTAGGFSCG